MNNYMNSFIVSNTMIENAEYTGEEMSTRRYQQSVPKLSDYKTVKQYNAHIRRMSPSTFIRLRYYTSPQLEERRKRVNASQFKIVGYDNYELLCKCNYNMNQLKIIAKHYQLKLSGNKQELLHRIYNSLKLGKYATIIQSYYRRYLVNKFIHVRGDAVLNRAKCVNESDFYTLDDVKDIPIEAFVSIREVQCGNEYVYGFHLDSLHEYIKVQTQKEDAEIENPYTRTAFQCDIIERVKQCIMTAKCLGYELEQPTQVIHEIQQAWTVERELRQCLMTIDDMGHLGNYVNHTWFDELTSADAFYRFCMLTYDIWDYRIGLTPEMKQMMCGGLRTCLEPYTIYHLKKYSHQIGRLKHIALKIVKNLISKSSNEDYRKNGGMIVITGLTAVNPNARLAFPALYMSLL